jgi:predicted outer membrane lipoprotein
MQLKKVVVSGSIAGLAMGIFLFIGGAVLSRIVYGPQFTPPGKFALQQMNAFYFIWTKLLIGCLFGILFAVAYELLPLSRRLSGVIHGMKYAFSFWLLTTLWNLSHPLVYGTVNVPDQLFWILYQLVGFLGFGAVLGYLYKIRPRQALPTTESLH